ncbi:energy transducer TonB [Mesorhizobium sp. SB112]|uniref:cell envelope integrity protein TolA n=1 Tax=Mesorhizobium sp. SB112 TaxID=3151853 RepID=UPI003263AF28
MMAKDKAPSLIHGSLPSLREVGRWTVAGVVVVTAHALAAYTIHSLSQQDLTAQAAESAMMIELAPLPVAPIEEVETVALKEQITEETVEPEEVEPEPVEEEVTEEVVEETPEEVVPEETAEEVPEEPEQEIAEAITPEVAIPLPQQRPKIVPEKPVAKKEPVKRKKPEPRAEPKREVAKAEPRPARASAATSRQSTAPSVSPAKWQSRVLAWLNRHKRYPRSAGGDQGTVSVRFSIDSSGNVVSASLSGSSGNADLDQAALDMVRRASPVPAPPPEIAKSRMSLTVPVRFSTR